MKSASSYYYSQSGRNHMTGKNSTPKHINATHGGSHRHNGNEQPHSRVEDKEAKESYA